MKSTGQKAVVGLAVLLGLATLVFLAKTAASYSELRLVARRLERAEMAAKQAGLFKDLTSYYNLVNIKRPENAGNELSKVVRKFYENPRLIQKGKVSPSSISELAEMKQEVDTLETLSKKKGYFVQRDYANPVFALYPDGVWSKYTVKLLCKQAAFERSQGNRAEAHRLLTVAARLTMLMDDDCFMIPNLIRCSLSVTILRTIADSILASPCSDKEAKSLLRIVSLLDQPYDFDRIVKADHWLSIKSVPFASPKRQDLLTKREAAENFFFKFCQYDDAANTRLHESYTQLLTSIPNDHHDYVSMRQAVEVFDLGIARKEPSFWFHRNYLPALTKSVSALESEAAARNVLIQALTMISNKSKSSQLPLKGRHENDTFGKQLSVTQTANGTLIYSTGRNGKDDGGIRDKVKKLDDFAVLIPR